jgi:hypothetical protein
MTGPLSHVALFRARNNPRYCATGQAGPFILSSEAEAQKLSLPRFGYASLALHLCQIVKRTFTSK